MSSSDAGEQAHLLVVEDEAPVRRFLTMALSAAGHRVTAVPEAQGALEVIARAPVDAALFDVRMPGMNGIELCRQVQRSERGRGLPIVILTALDRPEDVVEGLAAGAIEFLTKPIEARVLCARIDALLRLRRQHAEELGRASQSPDLPAAMRVRIERLAAEASLSCREREVLDLVLLGRSLDEIGVALGITARTAKFHQANLLEKLGADSRLDLFRILL